MKPILKMDEVDTAQQRQIDRLIYGVILMVTSTILWCSYLTFEVLRK